MKYRFFVFIFSFILLSGLLTACTSIDTRTSENSHSNSDGQITASLGNPKLKEATVVKNVDGDTLVINLNGREEKVRMLCIDTPETHHPRLGVQPFGPEAAKFTEETLYVGRKIQVETGIGDGRDKYGRLLAYIYVDGKMFNETLLEKGLARVAYIYPPNTKYVDQFYAVQKQAQDQGIGIWSIENYSKEDGFHKENAEAGSSSQKSSDNRKTVNKEKSQNCEGKIKGNANSHIYHVPEGAFYNSNMNNIVWFCTEKEAQDSGYRKSQR